MASSPKDFLQMQEKLRNNNESLESFMREINSWQEEMSAKDSQLSEQSCDKENQPSSRLSLIQKATVEKEKGNDHFKRGEYQKAVEAYTEGLRSDPQSAILAANRAMALLKLNREKEAERDCTLAISLDPTYAKAYIRRAYARSGLKRYSDAITDYEKVLEIEPKNKMAKTEIEKLRLLRQESFKKAPESKSSFEENMKNAFVSKSAKTPKAMETNDVLKDNEGDSNEFLREVSSKTYNDSSIVLPIDKPVHKRSKKPLKRIHIVDVVEPLAKKEEDPLGDTIEKDLSKGIQEIVQVSPSAPTNNNTKAAPPQKKLINKPNSSVQFYCTWRSLSTDAQRSELLQLLSPKEYGPLFKHSLESDVFSSMIRIFKQEFLLRKDLRERLPDILLSLSHAERLSVLLLFLEDEDKNNLKSIVEGIQGICESNKMNKIIKLFQ